MTPIQQSIVDITKQLPPHARLVAVSKYQPTEAIRQAYQAGQRIFGESHVQELCRKHDELPADIQWHFIGHLQTNKVKYLAPFVHLIHAVDSLRLLAEIHRQATRCGRTIPCLLQLHVAQEETKFGFTIDQCHQMLQSDAWRQYPAAQICGLMCMASNVDNQAQIEAEFEQARQFFQVAKDRYFGHDTAFCHCSWGMSHDYPLALAHGSTMVRVGSKIFGSRL